MESWEHRLNPHPGPRAVSAVVPAPPLSAPPLVPLPSPPIAPLPQLDAFDDDYLYFSEAYLTPERTEREAALIVALLGLEPGMSVLDLGCGQGRIANALARRGLEVTGIDCSSTALNRARAAAHELGVAVDYVAGDLRSLPWSQRFDCVLSWYTSFGLFDDDANRVVLERACRALVPGGRLLIEHINRDRSLRNIQDAMVHERGAEDFMIDTITFDPITSRSHRVRKFCRSGRVRTTRYFIRLFTFAELADWMRQAGLTSIRGHGRDGEPFSLSSERMIAVGVKPLVVGPAASAR